MKRKKKILILLILFILSIVTFLFLLKPAFIFGYTDKDLQKKLQELKAQSDAIVIHQFFPEGKPDVTLTGEDMKEFFSLLKLEIPEEYGHCLCLGDLKIMFQKSGKELTSISFHHGVSVRGLLPIGTDIFIVSEYRPRLRSFLEKHHITFR